MNKIKTLSPPKQKESTYLMADYVEMLCLSSQEGEVDIDEALSRVYHSAEFQAGLEAELVDDPESNIHSGELTDSQWAKGEDWFRHLEYRQQAFNGYYPFCVSGDTLILKYDFSPANTVYVFLLVCTRLGILKKGSTSITELFEMLSHGVLSNYLPSFTVHHFGKTPGGREKYPTKLKEAIPALCNNIHESLSSRFDPGDYSEKNTGDGGLDLLAFKFLGDNLPSNMVCFAQCACGPDRWIQKQYESSKFKWGSKIAFYHPPANYMFTPVCFRKPNGNWFQDKIYESILVDRLRICSNLNAADINKFDFYDCVQAFLDFDND